MPFPFLKDGFNILGCPVRFLVEGGSGERYRGKAQDFPERGLVWVFFLFPVLNCKNKVLPLTPEWKQKQALAEERDPEGDRPVGAGRGAASRGYRRVCRVLRRALNEKSFLQV